MKSALRLTKLIENAGMDAVHLTSNPEITGLAEDSRRVETGFLFTAICGTQTDGTKYIRDALARGASAIVMGVGTKLAIETDVPLIMVPDPRRASALLAGGFYSSQPSGIAAVTGTNGKTSVASFLRQIWSSKGVQAASLGTLGLESPGLVAGSWSKELSALTTPGPVLLHRALDFLASNGIQKVAIEASSHGLDQRRMDAVRVRHAGFTNLTRDHEDYHGSMASYLSAKLRLFDAVMEPGSVAVLNRNSNVFNEIQEVCKGKGHEIIHYGNSLDGRLTDGIDLLERKSRGIGFFAQLHFGGEIKAVNVPLTGQFQEENIMCSLGLAIAGARYLCASAQPHIVAGFHLDPVLVEAIDRLAFQDIKPVFHHMGFGKRDNGTRFEGDDGHMHVMTQVFRRDETGGCPLAVCPRHFGRLDLFFVRYECIRGSQSLDCFVGFSDPVKPDWSIGRIFDRPGTTGR